MRYSLLVFFLIVSSLQLTAQSQKHMRWASLSQDFLPMTLHFYDGTEISGKGKVKKIKDELLFRANTEIGEETYSLYEVKNLVAKVKNQTISFIFAQPKGYRRPLLLQQLRSGKLNVYFMERGFSAGGMIEIPDKPSYFFIEKTSNERGNPVIPYPQIARRFKKNAVKYFEDCPALIEKIKSKEFKSKDVLMIADFYNSECQ